MSIAQKVKEHIERVKRTLGCAELDERGHEILSSDQLAIPAGFKRPPTIQEQIRQAIRLEYLERIDSGYESPEEADDFDIGDDFDPESPYEHDFDHLGELESAPAPEPEDKPLPKDDATPAPSSD